MFTQINCNEKCIYQTSGVCTRNCEVDSIKELDHTKKCCFFRLKEDKERNVSKNSWTEILNNYFC